MKRISLFLMRVAAVFVLPFTASADPITLSQGFGDLEIVDSYTYTFDLSSVEALALSLDGATLSLTHQGNSHNPGEMWFATTGAGLPIGTLSQSTTSGAFVTDTWILSPASLSEMIVFSPWTFTIDLGDNTSGTDKILIRELVLNLNYTPRPIEVSEVPEPSSGLLLAGGLGLALFLRRVRS
ncbi:MAG: PEP-CTERM sorting domain-containing protein [Acidobacteriota bacterium]